MPFHPSPNLKLPPPLEGYTLIERLGRGGFGEVWKCEAPGGFLKAVKFVFGDLESTDESRPADQELKSLGRVKDIRHPYILTLERYDIIDGQLMVIMELADRNLWDRFRECRLQGKPGIPRAELLSYMAESAEALDLMNDRYRLQHLDIKPQNLFLVYDHIKVADFGLAKAFEGAVATVTGGVTPVYAAPETFQGEVSRFSDQYSLAVVYQELLTGSRPFNGQNTKQLLLQHLREPPDLTSLPDFDRAVIGRALAKDPDGRWPSCKELVRQLAAAPDSVTRVEFGAFPLPELAPTSSPPLDGATEGGPQVPREMATQQATAVREARTAFAATVPGHGPAAIKLPLRTPGLGLGGGTMTPMPNLITPKMNPGRTATSAPSKTVGMTGKPLSIVETGRMGALGIAPPERKGAGLLMPAIIVGLGRMGLQVIRRFRRLVRDRFGSISAAPHVRYLYIDVDPDDAAQATQGDDALGPQEVALAKLQRPGHYLQRDGLPPVDAWLPPGLLYSLPKSPTSTNGVRAFGRLALCDNYRLIAQRMRQEIEPLLNEDTLNAALKQTGLELRSNRPRVYVAASLEGGVGSGTFLDVAYLIKRELKNVGYRDPGVHGILFVPPSEKSTSRQALSNAHAALAELNHFFTQPYQVKFDTGEAPVTDSSPPFERVALIQWPAKRTEADVRKTVGQAARAAYLDLFTRLGERIDYVRSVAQVDRLAGPTVQPFGVYRLSWPRYELLASISRRFCQQVLRQWTAKETTHLKEPIQYWLVDQWSRYRLESDHVLARLEAGLVESLRGPPETAFEAVVASHYIPGSGKEAGDSAIAALDQFIKLVGKPDVEKSGGVPALLGLIDQTAASIIKEAETQLSTVAVSFIEMPQYRLAGAEEALDQIRERLRSSLETLEQDAHRAATEATTTYGKLFPIIGSLAGTGFSLPGRRHSLAGELQELLKKYPRQRLKALLLGAAVTLFRKLRDGLPEYLRDVNFCRAKLAEFSEALSSGAILSEADAEPGSFVLPQGCPTLETAADQFIAVLPADDILLFDQDLQARLQSKFRGLVNVCLRAERGAKFPELFLTEARKFLEARLENANPAEALERYRGSGPDCIALLEQCYDGAKATVAAKAQEGLEAAILGLPAGPSGERLRLQMQDANPGVEFIPSPLDDDIVIYREYPRFPIADLPQLGDQAALAYRAQNTQDHPAHTRSDVEWLPPRRA